MKTEEVLCLSTLEGLHMISHGYDTGRDSKRLLNITATDATIV